MTPRCHFCSHPYSPEVRGRSEECSGCGRDLHVCLNCEFYDRSAYNECRESQADRVVEKDRANFCDYFRPVSRAASPASTSATAKSDSDLRSALDELFKK